MSKVRFSIAHECLVFITAFLSATAAHADGLASLNAFLKEVQSARAQFQQTVLAPAKEGQASRSKVSSGTFEFQRPNRFRFVYLRPFEQTIVADGKTLWVYDRDLFQVTIRKQSAALGSTPAALIASAGTLAALESDFTIVAQPFRDGLDWAMATPKSKDSTVQSLRLGFKGPLLLKLEMVDSFGQTSSLHFSAFQLNPVLEASAFQFKIPDGADVIHQ